MVVLRRQLAIVNAAQLQALAIGGTFAAGAFVLWRYGGKVADVAGGALTGNNTLTQTATNSAGERVTAYENAGVFGTLGAATNAASGGALASFGEWLGGTAYDLTHDDPTPATSSSSSSSSSSSWSDFSLGGWIYDVTHADPMAPAKQTGPYDYQAWESGIFGWGP